MENDDFEKALAALADGYSEGWFSGRRYGVTVRRSPDGRRTSLFARELAGNDVVSFNLYRTAIGGTVLKPCEMPANKVTAFMLDLARGGLLGEDRAASAPESG